MSNPEVMKRLEEIEAVYDEVPGILWLLKLTRALLESQWELLEALIEVHVGEGCDKRGCTRCTAIVRAERIRKGEV